MKCTALKVHASAPTHVLQFLAHGWSWGGQIISACRELHIGFRVSGLGFQESFGDLHKIFSGNQICPGYQEKNRQ